MTQKENPVAQAGANRVGGGFQRDAGRHRSSAPPLDLQHFDQIVLGLLGEPNRARSNKSFWRYGGSAGLTVNLQRKVWYDHKEKVGGGLFGLVIYLGHATTNKGAAQWLRDKGFLASDGPIERQMAAIHRQFGRDEATALREDAIRRKFRRGVARALWQNGRRIIGTIAETYLRARAIPPRLFENCEDLRFVSACPLTPYGRASQTLPALVARVVNNLNRAVGVHVTYLAADGAGKAAIETPRKLVGAEFNGACVRLGVGPHVIVAEGIESALSAGDALNLSPVAALSAGGVKSWRSYEGVHQVTFAPDQDASGVGMKSARDAAERLFMEGVAVVGFAIPPGGHNDWNDAARAGLIDDTGNEE